MMNRRMFVSRTLVTGAGVMMGVGRLGAAGSGGHPIRLGAPVFVDSGDPEAYARAHRELGYAAAYCPDVPVSDTGRIREYVSAFERHRVVVAEVGRWVNLMDADAEKRAANLKRVTEGLALAEEFGALCCVDIAGSMNPTVWYGPHPDNLSPAFFDAAVENARKIIDAVRPKRAKFCYEMMGWALPDSVESCLDMLRAVDRRGFGVHLDPCNLIHSPRRFYGSTALLHECFDKLGPHVVSCHAKDLSWEIEMNVHFREVIPGTGSLDYRVFLRRLSELRHQPPLMLEHLKDAKEYDQGRRFILEVGAREGLSFG
jgi:sugar phosphate isomerase/epimerase